MIMAKAAPRQLTGVMSTARPPPQGDHQCGVTADADERDQVAERAALEDAAADHDGETRERRRHGDPGGAEDSFPEQQPGEDRGDERKRPEHEHRVGDRGVEQGPHEANQADGKAAGTGHAAPADGDERGAGARPVAHRRQQQDGERKRDRAVEDYLPAVGRLQQAHQQAREAEANAAGEDRGRAENVAPVGGQDRKSSHQTLGCPAGLVMAPRAGARSRPLGRRWRG